MGVEKPRQAGVGASTGTNGLNQTRTVTKDSDGQTVSVVDAAGKTTSFAYDPFGKLIRIPTVRAALRARN